LGASSQGICEAGQKTALHEDVNTTFVLASNTQSVAAMESELQGMAMESDNDWLAEHESNGPEEGIGVPMQRMSLGQVGLVFAVLFGSVALVARARKNNTPEKCKTPQ
jgi:hypothetical protein